MDFHYTDQDYSEFLYIRNYAYTVPKQDSLNEKYWQQQRIYLQPYHTSLIDIYNVDIAMYYNCTQTKI